MVRPKLLSNMNYFYLSQKPHQKTTTTSGALQTSEVESFTGRNCGVYAAAINLCHESKKIVMCDLLAKHLGEGESGKG